MQNDIVKRPPADPINRNNERPVAPQQSSPVVQKEEPSQDIKTKQFVDTVDVVKQVQPESPKDSTTRQPSKDIAEKPNNKSGPKQSKPSKDKKPAKQDQKAVQVSTPNNSSSNFPFLAIFTAIIICVLLVAFVIYSQLSKSTT